MKQEIRVLGIDDSPFTRTQRNVLVVGAVFRGNRELDGLISGHIQRDGRNATRILARMIKESKFIHRLRAIFLDGIAVGGFNVINIQELHDAVKIPIIVIMRHRPDLEQIFHVLTKLGQLQKIIDIRNAGQISSHKKIYFQRCGISEEEAREIIDLSTAKANIPEALRIAHIIASGIVKGESYGRA